MIAHHELNGQQAEMPGNDSFASTLPSGFTIQKIAFVSEIVPDQKVLLEFPPPILRRAVIVQDDPQQMQSVLSNDLFVLAIPAAMQEMESETLSKMRGWIDAGSGATNPPSMMMTLQGAQVLWKAGRLAIFAPPNRLETVRASLIEASYYEAELRDMERILGETWPQLEADMPLAFEFEERSISQRKQLRQRFGEALKMRARLARIGPHVHCPHLHPPTLASQVGERFRERTRMVHRHEFLSEQIEVFERVYDMCGERASNFMLARSGNTLEWIIIVLLLTQLLLSGFETLTSTGP